MKNYFKFYDREEELIYLENWKKASDRKNVMAAIYGRRRIGKTRLVQEAFKNDENFIYFFVSEKQSKTLLDEFSDIFKNKTGLPVKFSTWDEFFKTILEQKKLIVIFDEFQNFLKIDKSIISILQKELENFKEKSGIFIIILGSFVGLIKETFVEYKSPLYGRVDFKINLKQFDFKTVEEILTDYGFKNDEFIVNYYSIFGGVPKYYEILHLLEHKTQNIYWYIKELLLKPDAPLKNEAKQILIQEFGRDYLKYFAILESIANGKNSLIKISENIGEAPTTVSKYLTELVKEYEILKRNIPVTENMKEKSKKGRYVIEDNLFRFYFRFIHSQTTYLEQENIDFVIEKIARGLNQNTGKIFEKIMMQKLKNKHSNIKKFGGWWDSKSEIDIVGINEVTKEILLAECKWQDNKVARKTAEEFLRKTKRVKWNVENRHEILIIVSKEGFTKNCEEFCKINNIQMLKYNSI